MFPMLMTHTWSCPTRTEIGFCFASIASSAVGSNSGSFAKLNAAGWIESGSTPKLFQNMVIRVRTSAVKTGTESAAEAWVAVRVVTLGSAQLSWNHCHTRSASSLLCACGRSPPRR